MLIPVHHITMKMTGSCICDLNAMSNCWRLIFLKWWTVLGNVPVKLRKQKQTTKTNKKTFPSICIVVALPESCPKSKLWKKIFKFMWNQRFYAKIIINRFLSYRTVFWDNRNSCKSWDIFSSSWIVKIVKIWHSQSP